MAQFFIALFFILMPYSTVLGLECYRWTTADYEIINNGGWKKENERRMCVDVYNYVFAPDESSNDRKCGSCWCCKPEIVPALNECENKQCGDLCSEGVCDGDGFCVSPEFNPCSVYACDGKKCGETCLFNATRQGVCNKDLECDFDVNSVITSGQCEANGKWEKGNFILGPKGSGVCSEGTPIMDATACREACGTLDIPQREIYGFNKCYKETKHRHERCYQNGQPGSGARMICIKSELISVYKEHSGACTGAENDIGSSSGLTLLACQQKCDATQGCGAVSWAYNDCHMTSDMANTTGDGSYWTCYKKVTEPKSSPTCKDQKPWCRIADCNLTNVKENCPKKCNTC